MQLALTHAPEQDVRATCAALGVAPATFYRRQRAGARLRAQRRASPRGNYTPPRRL